MKLGQNQRHSGTVVTERVAKDKDGKVLARQSRTERLGPFSRDEHAARVGATVGTTLSRNYHAVQIQVTVNIPAHPSEEGVDAGLAWVFSKCNDVLNEQLIGARKALGKLAKE